MDMQIMQSVRAAAFFLPHMELRDSRKKLALRARCPRTNRHEICWMNRVHRHVVRLHRQPAA